MKEKEKALIKWGLYCVKSDIFIKSSLSLFMWKGLDYKVNIVPCKKPMINSNRGINCNLGVGRVC